MGGAPVFSLFEFALPLARIRAVRGILNSTSNFVLSEMRRGISGEMAIAEAKRLGIAETDPDHDLDGWDAALKLTILANVLMKERIRVDEVDREPGRHQQTLQPTMCGVRKLKPNGTRMIASRAKCAGSAFQGMIRSQRWTGRPWLLSYIPISWAR
jgi:homoserine dehydrogenase